ncbi:MAG: hypothetical protein JWM44_3973 [Bacilli bacterium]|nr:hypothetical protein [Bacilli bacterium]
MRRLFFPGVSLMNRLSYLQKFSLIGLLFLLPIGLTLYLLISDLNQKIAVVKLETEGVEYNAVVRHLVEHIQQHRGLTYMMLNGDTENKQAVAENEKLINEDIANMDWFENKLDEKWANNSHWVDLKREWQALLSKTGSEGSSLDNFTKHSDIVKLIQAQISSVNSYSGLKQDREGSSLIEGLLDKLPEMLETVGQARGLSSGAVAGNFLTEADRLRMIVLAGTFEPEFEVIQKDLQDYSYISRSSNDLQPYLVHYALTFHIFHDELTQTILRLSDFSQIHSQNQFNLGTDALNDGYKLFDAGIPILNDVLKQKMDALKQKKYFVTGFTCLVGLLLVYLFVGFYLSVHRAIYKLMRSAARMSNGNLRERVYLDTKDELQAVGIAYNKMAISLEKMLNERESQEEQIKFLAYHDSLTGLPNRVLFNDRLGQALAMASRNQELVGVMFLDLDRFKAVNDTYGHSVGDSLLQNVAERLKLCLRASDTVTRMGGDEFMIILSGLKELDQMTGLAEKLLAALSMPLKLESLELTISGSLGISVFPQHGNDPEVLIRNADAAMYYAKSQGRNSYQLYEQEMNAQAKERLQMEKALHEALIRDEFLLHYQPKQQLATGQITGVEALIRWQHAEQGLLYPEDFISLAEESGSIIEIGEWVLRSACLQNKAWQKEGLSPIRVSVNISALQFQRDDFYQCVNRVLKETGLEPCWLELELTESMVMRNAPMTITKLNLLRELGVKISIDDFGTGFSSLSYLKLFPIDTLKMDNSFIQDISADSKDAAITKTVIALARRLKLSVVAEGVETYEQLVFLRARKCTEIQGYIISEPLEVEEMTTFLKMR